MLGRLLLDSHCHLVVEGLAPCFPQLCSTAGGASSRPSVYAHPCGDDCLRSLCYHYIPAQHKGDRGYSGVCRGKFRPCCRPLTREMWTSPPLTAMTAFLYIAQRGESRWKWRLQARRSTYDKLHQLLYEEDAVKDWLAALFSLQLDYRCVISWLCCYAWWLFCAVCSSVRDAMQPCVMEPLVWFDPISTVGTAAAAKKSSAVATTSVHASSGMQSLPVPPASSSPDSLSTRHVYGISAAQFSSQLDDIAAIVSSFGVPQNTAALDGVSRLHYLRLLTHRYSTLLEPAYLDAPRLSRTALVDGHAMWYSRV